MCQLTCLSLASTSRYSKNYIGLAWVSNTLKNILYQKTHSHIHIFLNTLSCCPLGVHVGVLTFISYRGGIIPYLGILITSHIECTVLAIKCSLCCAGLVWEQHADADTSADTALQPLPVPAELQLQERNQCQAPLPSGDRDQHPPGGEEGVTREKAQEWVMRGLLGFKCLFFINSSVKNWKSRAFIEQVSQSWTRNPLILHNWGRLGQNLS